MTEVFTPQSICCFGLAHGDITPPVGIYHRMWGAATHDRATGVHRPLRATVAAFAPADHAGLDDSAHTKNSAATPNLQVLIALDHCILGAGEMEALLDAVSAGSGVAPDRLCVVFSHTHASGLLSADRVSLPGGDLIPAYLDQLQTTVVELVKRACQRLEPATVTYGTGRCDLAAHRDFWDAEREQYVCGFDPHTPADDTVVVARVTDAEDRLLATVVNYACHPTTLAWENSLISPDFPGAMREVVENATGAPCLFLQGASAELGPKVGFTGDVEVADRNGRQLGYAAVSALEAIPPANTYFKYTGPVVSGATLGTWQHVALGEAPKQANQLFSVRRWRLPLQYREDLPTADAVRQELAELEHQQLQSRSRGEDEEAARLRALAERRRRLSARLAQLPDGDEFPLLVMVWRIGGAAWVAVQGEHYSVLQTALRERFANLAVVVSTIAMDWSIAYLPPAELYGRGIYQEQVALAAPGSLEQVIEAIAGQLAATTAAATPRGNA